MDFNPAALADSVGGYANMENLIFLLAGMGLTQLGKLAKKTKTLWDDKAIGLFKTILPFLRRK